jgi:SAM-dependent methyltransferase
LNPSTKDVWNTHYKKEKSKLSFPDENLVRILSRLQKKGKALDFGAGSGRHSFLLKSFGFQVVALDYAQASLEIIREADPEIETIHSESYPYPIQDSSMELVVSWGVLHYNTDLEITHIVKEYKRILKQDGYLVGTLRADKDTHLNLESGKIQLSDLKNAQARLFRLEELKDILSDFRDLQFGYMERTPIGNLDQRIAHWIFQAKK